MDINLMNCIFFLICWIIIVVAYKIYKLNSNIVNNIADVKKDTFTVLKHTIDPNTLHHVYYDSKNGATDTCVSVNLSCNELYNEQMYFNISPHFGIPYTTAADRNVFYNNFYNPNFSTAYLKPGTNPGLLFNNKITKYYDFASCRDWLKNYGVDFTSYKTSSNRFSITYSPIKHNSEIYLLGTKKNGVFEYKFVSDDLSSLFIEYYLLDGLLYVTFIFGALSYLMLNF